jgi:type IV secretory pathway VirB10-like protein
MASQAVGPQVPPKPFKISKWFLGAFALFVVGYLILSLLQHRISAVGTTDKAAQQAPSGAPASQSDVEAFNRARSQKLLDLAKKRALMEKEIAAAGLGEVDAIAIINQLPPCTQAQRESLKGQNYVAVNQKTHQLIQFACETDDNWHPLPAAASDITLPTPQQQDQMVPQSRRSNGGGDGMTPKQRKEEALRRALASSGVVDFSLPGNMATAVTPGTVTAAALPPAMPSAPLMPTMPGQTPPFPPAAEAKLMPLADHGTAPEDPHNTKDKYPWSTSTGPLFRVFEGDVIEGILTNRIAGEMTGPVNVMVTTNLYSRDRLHILVPQGTRILGESAKVGISGQRRLAVPFHRVIMPDGYSVDLDHFDGLDQQGATGLTGRVNSHWPKIIATAALVGAIGGLSEVGATGTTLSGLSGIRLGVTQQTGQEATQILDRALNILPTITIYEGTRVRIWVQRDLQLPAYENHTISPTL